MHEILARLRVLIGAAAAEGETRAGRSASSRMALANYILEHADAIMQALEQIAPTGIVAQDLQTATQFERELAALCNRYNYDTALNRSDRALAAYLRRALTSLRLLDGTAGAQAASRPAADREPTTEEAVDARPAPLVRHDALTEGDERGVVTRPLWWLYHPRAQAGVVVIYDAQPDLDGSGLTNSVTWLSEHYVGTISLAACAPLRVPILPNVCVAVPAWAPQLAGVELRYGGR